MNWVNHITQKLSPSFGGLLTYCVDKDNILEIPEVRECVRRAGLKIVEFNNVEETFYLNFPEEDRPVVILENENYRHLIESKLVDYRWVSISIGGIFHKFSYDVIKDIPIKYWEKIFDLQNQPKYAFNVSESAVFLSRALYNADPLHISSVDGTCKLLFEIVLLNEGLPKRISEVLCANMHSSFSWVSSELLEDPVALRNNIINELNENPELIISFNPITQLYYGYITEQSLKRGFLPRNEGYEFTISLDKNSSPKKCLEVAIRYSQAVHRNTISDEQRKQVNSDFESWIINNFNQVYQPRYRDVLKSSNLLKYLDEKTQINDRSLLIIIDGLGLAEWFDVQRVWEDEAIIPKVQLLPVFATIPTLTSISRRSIFEEKIPTHFSNEEHSDRFERKLWHQRYTKEAAYFSSKETYGILDSFAIKKKRLCVVDVSWDQTCHKINLSYGTLKDSLKSWAQRTELKNIIKEALKNKYKIYITSDHGQIACEGKGQHNTGELTLERSKRVLLFNNKFIRNNFLSNDTFIIDNTFHYKELFPLFCKSFFSFDKVGNKSLSHGGISFDEVVVPFVEVG